MHHGGAAQALDRGDVDDRAAAGRLHRLDRSLHAEERAGQVDVDDLLPLRHVELADLAQRDDAGVVDQNVELAELVDRGGDRGVPLVGLGDVEVDVARGVTDLVGQRLALVVEDVADDHLGALGDQHPRVLCAHAPCAATDQCNFSVHASHDGSGYRARVLRTRTCSSFGAAYCRHPPERPWRSASRSSAPATAAASRCKQLVERRALRPDRRLGVLGRQGGQGRGRTGRPGASRPALPPTNDLDAIIAAKPDCVVYCAMGDIRLAEAMADIRRILAAGIDVVGSAPGVLQYPWQVIPDKYIERIEDAAREGNSTRLHHRRRSRVRDRSAALRVGRNVPEHRAGPHHGDRRLRHLRRRDGDVRRHGLRQPDRRLPDAVPAGRAEHRLGHRDPAARGGPRRSRSTRSGTPSNRSLRRRISTSPRATSPRARWRRCASRSRAWSRASR